MRLSTATTSWLFMLFPALAKADFWFSTGGNVNALSSNGSTVLCELPGLSKRQRKLCGRHYDHMRYVIEGSHNAIVECKNQFEDERWNCPTERDSRRTGSAFNRLGKKNIREMAFVQAITSAGIVHSVATACRRMTLKNCGCASTNDSPRNNTEVNDDIRWCKYIEYASDFTEKFTSEKVGSRKKLSPKKQMELHNRRVGRLAVQDAAVVRCKCHGLKGSCSLKTCWIELGSLKDVGLRLKRAYDNAVRARVEQGRIQPDNIHFGKNDLIFLQNSPNFCDRNRELRTPGTQGRLCQRHGMNSSNCEILCCGRGSIFKEVVVTEQCNCSFHWCCRLSCMRCIRTIRHDVCL